MKNLLRKFVCAIFLFFSALSFISCSEDVDYRLGDDDVPDDYCEIMTQLQVGDICYVQDPFNLYTHQISFNQFFDLINGDWKLWVGYGWPSTDNDEIDVKIDGSTVAYTYKGKKHEDVLQNVRKKPGFYVAKLRGVGNVAVSGFCIYGARELGGSYSLSCYIVSDKGKISQRFMSRELTKEEYDRYIRECNVTDIR